MHVALALSSLPVDFAAAVRQAAALGFTHVDVMALEQRPIEDLEALAESGLVVSCASLGRKLPEGCALDTSAVEPRRIAVEVVKRHVTDAAQLGATHAYVVPGFDSSREGMLRFAESCALLADFAGRRMVRLCVEAFPGRALPSVAATLDWLKQVGHPNLSLLLDVGHCLISGEDSSQAIEQAGARLGYVHVDDNDGINDVHWPLLTGQLTDAMLRAAVEALMHQDYQAALELELNPKSAQPLEAARQGKALLERLFAEVTPAAGE
jgi:sugar phosphate isomerase/epimerase